MCEHHIITTGDSYVCDLCGLVIEDRPLIAQMQTTYEGKKDFVKNDVRCQNEYIPSMWSKLPVSINWKINDFQKVQRENPKWGEFMQRISKNLWTYSGLSHYESQFPKLGMRLNQYSSVFELDKLQFGKLQKFFMDYWIACPCVNDLNLSIIACVYLATRDSPRPWTIKDLIPYLETKSRHLIQILHHKIQEICQVLQMDLPSLNKTSLVASICNQLQLSNYEMSIHLIYTEALTHYRYRSGDPKGILAACIYYFSLKHKLKVAQSQISKVCNITDVTLRNHLKYLCKKGMFLYKTSHRMFQTKQLAE